MLNMFNMINCTGDIAVLGHNDISFNSCSDVFHVNWLCYRTAV